jgi:hypothetical protein
VLTNEHIRNLNRVSNKARGDFGVALAVATRRTMAYTCMPDTAEDLHNPLVDSSQPFPRMPQQQY